ncbi:DNA recombination protein RmuC [Candidatus Uhrbacteria bacterium]|nr:DNA recombination protein RmuC [Candidatus Uhrbacteria bacterium]
MSDLSVLIMSALVLVAGFAVMAVFFSHSLKKAHEELARAAKEHVGSGQVLAQKDLESKKDSIAQLVQEMRREIAETRERMEKSDQQRIATFSTIKQELDTHKDIMHQLRGSTDDLKKILSNNQLRGAFGEQVAENLLKMAGFVVGQDYIYNKEQESTDTRPDYTLFLPDKTKINIDVKFPYAALMKMSSTDDKQEKELHTRQFATDVKQKIKQVTNRDYINPEDKTVDFVVLFIPNEMIFSFIYDQLHEVWEEAMQRKVIMTGPFSFTAILRMVKQAYSNFRYQENLHHVIGLIQKFEIEYGKFSESLDTLGDRLESVKKQFDAVSKTRSNSLQKVINQIQNQNILPEPSSEETQGQKL